MTNFQARIKPAYQKRFPQPKPCARYDVDPLWPVSNTRVRDLFCNRVTPLVTGGAHTSPRAGYLDFRHHPKHTTTTP